MIKLKIRKVEKYWIFDDEEKSIKLEPFVKGSSLLIDFFKEKQKIKRKKLNLIVSDLEFENCESTMLIKHNESTRWSIYYNNDFGHHQLCPVLLEYFKEPPKIIYFKIEK